MFNRHKFLERTALLGAAGLMPRLLSARSPKYRGTKQPLPAVVSTWRHGLPSNKAALKIMQQGGSVVDAVEHGVWVPEGNPDNHKVGLGGYPNRDGGITPDASIKGPDGNAGLHYNF